MFNIANILCASVALNVVSAIKTFTLSNSYTFAFFAYKNILCYFTTALDVSPCTSVVLGVCSLQIGQAEFK